MSGRSSTLRRGPCGATNTTHAAEQESGGTRGETDVEGAAGDYRWSRRGGGRGRARRTPGAGAGVVRLVHAADASAGRVDVGPARQAPHRDGRDLSRWRA